MCRFIAYTGPEIGAADLLVVPPHSLFEQCRSPRYQTRTNDNPDGFGISWFEDGELKRYRKPVPMWEDDELPSVARTTRARHFLAAIRKATPGLAIATENTAPYIADGMSFAHNGSVEGWVEGTGARVREMVSERRLGGIEGTTDSEVLFALVLSRLDDGMSRSDAIASACVDVGTAFGGWLNLLLHDGERIVATSWGNSLFVLERDGAVIVASEPFDNRDDWRQIPDRMLVEAGSDGVDVSSLISEEVRS
ncbi:MAG: class II glutamine amidotransferase [Actinomycetota bacterium]